MFTGLLIRYVLKKMECKDEAEANKAFKEAMALQELAHPYICGYRYFAFLFYFRTISMNISK